MQFKFFGNNGNNYHSKNNNNCSHISNITNVTTTINTNKKTNWKVHIMNVKGAKNIKYKYILFCN